MLGPTASGKTALSIDLAKKLNAEIISADSRQVYKYIQIATCAPTKDELSEIKHYFVNELEPGEEFSAGLFAKNAKQIIQDILTRKKNVLIIGGSGLYIKALIDGFYEEDISDTDIRNKLNERLKSEGRDALYKELMSVDPETAEKMDPGKFRRVIRALEVYHASGKKISFLQKNNVKPDFLSVQAGLKMDRALLYERINKRVDKMIEDGLLEEVEALRQRNMSYKSHNSLNTVGIKEVFQYFDGELSKDTMISNIKMNTRRYAKRQMTWFNADNRINWVETNEIKLAEKLYKIYIS